MMEQLMSIINGVGFPIGITIYLLVTRDKIIQDNTAATRELVMYLKNRK